MDFVRVWILVKSAKHTKTVRAEKADMHGTVSQALLEVNEGLLLRRLHGHGMSWPHFGDKHGT